jgi:hypothetical protein
MTKDIEETRAMQKRMEKVEVTANKIQTVLVGTESYIGIGALISYLGQVAHDAKMPLEMVVAGLITVFEACEKKDQNGGNT